MDVITAYGCLYRFMIVQMAELFVNLDDDGSTMPRFEIILEKLMVQPNHRFRLSEIHELLQTDLGHRILALFEEFDIEIGNIDRIDGHHFTSESNTLLSFDSVIVCQYLDYMINRSGRGLDSYGTICKLALIMHFVKVSRAHN